MEPSIRRFFAFLGVCALLFSFFVFSVAAEEQKVGVSLPQPLLLPTSPFYFLKEWRRNLMRSFTRDTLSQIVLELDILDEKAGELKKIHDLKPADYAAIKDSLENYKKTQDVLRARLQDVSQIRKEKDRDAVVKELFARLSLHNKIFGEIFSSYPENTQAKEQLEGAKQKIADSAVKAGEGVSETKFKELVKSSFVPSDSQDVGEELSLMELMKGTASEQTKHSLEDIERELLFGTSTATSTLGFTTSTASSTLQRVCVMIYEPVCGADGKTYGNACLLQNAGVSIKQKGECEKKNE